MTHDAFDTLVVGGGHAGAEAAWAAAHLGARTALITFDRQAIGRLSCNPAIGGIGKGQIVREIDALGGLMGLVADEAGIQFRMLNRRKGPAVWAPRAQVDYDTYPAILQRHLQTCPNLTIIESGIERLECVSDKTDGSAHRITAVELTDGRRLHCGACVIASGTFLRGLMHTGERKTTGGRVGERAADGLSTSLEALGLELARLKTGTPPRLARDSIDFAALRQQEGDPQPAPFSFMTDRIECEQICCWLTATTPAVHDLIRANLDRAPMYSGQIESRGPRYCPSIEDKVVRFADKQQHQLFLEPEGRDSDRIYANGISTSLPEDVQHGILKLTPGLEHARILQLGYAIEYDFVPPEQITVSLMTKRVRGLFLAGQINGTSGYEEAAGQGLLAGINAARLLSNQPPVTIGRDQGYIGVMIDDLVTQGVTEPYRMFTSRAEHRMHLRYDNADTRLTPLGRQIGLVDDARWSRFESHQRRLGELMALLGRLKHDGQTLATWLKRPDEDGERFAGTNAELREFRDDASIWPRALVEIKYAGYIERQLQLIGRFRELEERPIAPGTDFSAIPQLRREAVERLTAVQPANLGQAARISGVHPADISVLMVALTR